ncbi:hypothetical protein QQF64_000068 [Cirrhinus molitorella]|uniref:Alpha-macroglobulin receptor-binding domain-containing protein n=1 Tax=Cirrhinus molitorella TaxID=172907 RepID=A0ABR3NW41_9TELE
MDFFYKNDKIDATMTIIDIGLPTGFDAEENDLKELSTGKERYIQKFENNKELSERGYRSSTSIRNCKGGKKFFNSDWIK